MTTTKSPWLYFPNGKRFSLDWLAAHEKVEQDQLQAVFDNEERVHCLCKSRKGDDPSLAPELYLSHRHGKLHLSRMPNTGDQHASWCPFHGVGDEDMPPPVQSIQANFKLDLDAANALLASMGIAPKRDDIPANEQYMSLSAVLQRLWRWSGNHRYFADHTRDWNRVRHFLQKTAQQASIQEVLVAERLFIPKHYELGKKPERDDVFWQWYDGLTQQSRPGPLGLLLAPVKCDKEVMPQLIQVNKKLPEWPQLALADVPMRVTLSERALQQLLAERTKTLDWWQGKDNQAVNLIGLFLVGRGQATIEGKSKQVLLAYQAAWMPVLRNFVPAFDAHEAAWLQQLIDSEIDYTKILATPDEGYVPNFWIHDAQGQRISAMIANGDSEREKVLAARKEPLLVWRTDKTADFPLLDKKMS